MTPATATTPAASPSLAWSEDLVLGMDAIDRTHEEFVALLARAETAADQTLLDCLQALTEHTIEHFGREDQWMQATQFAPEHCHAMQHRVVLQTLDELMRRGSEDGDLQLVREILPELGKWFHQHAQTMDAGLAAHLDKVGFDPATGHMSRPTGRPHEDLAACGMAAGPCAG